MTADITEFAPRKCEAMMFDAVAHMMDAAGNFETRLVLKDKLSATRRGANFAACAGRADH
jgi:hypothetical protein